MKKMILFVMLLAAIVNVNAQSGSVTVKNQTDCDIAIDVWATCPDCSSYSSGLMQTIPAGTNVVLYTTGSAYWSPTDPETVCPGEWKWTYAAIVYFCEGSHCSVKIADPAADAQCLPLPHPNPPITSSATCTISQDCADQCNGGNTTVNFAWSNQSGNIVISIY